MKKALFLFISFILVAYAYNQTWTEPIQINTLDGLNHNPDFCIDNEGNLHCVWSYKIETNYFVIYYSKSTDDGLSWSTPTYHKTQVYGWKILILFLIPKTTYT